MFTGKKNAKNEYIIPTSFPKSFLICVKPNIPIIDAHIHENILYAIMLFPQMKFIICNMK